MYCTWESLWPLGVWGPDRKQVILGIEQTSDAGEDSVVPTAVLCSSASVVFAECGYLNCKSPGHKLTSVLKLDSLD